MDPRYTQLAQQLVNFSVSVHQGDRVLLDLLEVPESMAVALIRAVRARGGHPFIVPHQARVMAELLRESDPAEHALSAGLELQRMQQMQAYIAVRGSHNIFEMAQVPAQKISEAMQAFKPVLDHRVNHTRWCVLRWPHPGMAQQAQMGTEGFEDFFFKVCTLDYSRMTEGMEALKARMEATDRVHIRGPGTDLSFSIKGIPAVCCGGKHNLPDGEVFTAPVRDSVQGYIQYNAPSLYQGTAFDRVTLRFKDGQIVESDSSNPGRLTAILDSDPGARYIGEFALGFNPHILEPMRDILFDEKIAGSFHFTPGQAYEQADNGNRSQVHWDLVCIQRPEYGGGEVYFDGQLVRKDGLFVDPQLKSLNPEFLLKEGGPISARS